MRHKYMDIAASTRRLAADGVIHVPNAVARAMMDDVRTQAMTRFGEVLRALLLKQVVRMRDGLAPVPTKFLEVVERDGGRLDVRHECTDGTFAPLIAAAASPGSRLGDALVAILGEDCEVVAVGNVVAMCTRGWIEAGLADEDEVDEEVVMSDNLGTQAWHADGPHLFAAPSCPQQLPVHAVTVFLPLVDLDGTNGPTEFAPGSQMHGCEVEADADTGEAMGNCATSVILARVGEAIIFDYRTWHRGLANASDDDRPVLYMVVAKPWWTDSRNYRQGASLFEGMGRGKDRKPATGASSALAPPVGMGVPPLRVQIRPLTAPTSAQPVPRAREENQETDEEPADPSGKRPKGEDVTRVRALADWARSSLTPGAARGPTRPAWPPERLRGFGGRVCRGRCDEEFASLHPHGVRVKPFVWVVGEDGLDMLLSPATAGMGADGGDERVRVLSCLRQLGFEKKWLRAKLANGETFRLALFPLDAAQPASWDGIFALVRTHFPEAVASKVLRCEAALRSESFATLEARAQHGFLRGATYFAVNELGATDERFLDSERLGSSSCAGTPEEVRGWLYFVLGCSNLYDGSGWTYNGTNGQRCVREYLIVNRPTRDFGSFAWVDLPLRTEDLDSAES